MGATRLSSGYAFLKALHLRLEPRGGFKLGFQGLGCLGLGMSALRFVANGSGFKGGCRISRFRFQRSRMACAPRVLQISVSAQASQLDKFAKEGSFEEKDSTRRELSNTTIPSNGRQRKRKEFRALHVVGF